MARLSWDKAEITATLKKMHKEGKELSYTQLAKRMQPLVSAAAYHFGSYRKAVERAGIDYAEVTRRPRWTRQMIIALIKDAKRDGADLHCRVPISMVAAALGGEFEVPTIDKGKTKVKVPSGTQSGRRFRIASKGMPVLRSRQLGDMYVQVVVETPQNLTKKQQELLAEFEKLSSGATQPEAAGFFTKVKDFFGNRASP